MTARRPAPALRQQKPAGAATGRNLHERIANEIGERIISGVYPPESPLPTEADLSASLGISRSVLREAFKLLSAKGLIVSRQKIGAMVRPQAEWNMLDPEVLSWHLRTVPTDHFVSSLFEVRKIVEPAAAALAAERRTAELVRRIETALADMVRFQNAPGDLIAADLRFHQAVLDTTGNPFLASFGAVIESSLIGSFQLSWNAEANTPDYALRQHRTVFEAIRDGQPNDAFAAMTQLLRSAIEDVRDALLHRQIRMNAQG
ncbi:MAG TPA: FadR/GntR family transcriptional regulator [Acetobacteraceae bacterium]|nr:FadR/GntR family transcriptional regulator [Acetobacteraceae bacterium]